MAWLRRNAPIVLLGAVLVASAAMLLALGAGTTFFQDTWGLLLDRQGFNAEAFFKPHNEHIAVFPTALEKLEVALFGMTSSVPERIVMTLGVVTAAALLFVYVRRRIGDWPALIATVLLLFLGPAWADMIWPFQIGFVGSALFGIAMLLALDRGDRRGDLAACACLTLSIGFSSLGLPFVAAAAVDVLVRRRSHGLRRAWVAAIPALLYAAWWLGYGREAETHVTLNNVLRSPQYMLEGMASAVEALLGLNKSGPDTAVPPEWGLPLLVALFVLVGFAQVRRPGVSPRFWPVAAAATASWLLAAFNTIPGREAYQNRYLYAGAIFVLLLAAELLRGVRISKRALLVTGVVTLAAVSVNLVQFREGSKWLKDQALLTKADLGAIEIARRTVDPNFVLTLEVSGTASLAIVDVADYLEAVDAHGSPAYSPRELARAPEVGRRQADIVLAQALPLSTETFLDAEPRPEGECTTVSGGTGSPEVRVPAGTTRIEVTPGPEAAFSLRRFAEGEYPVPTEGAPGASTTLLTVPRDAAVRPWYLHVEARQDVRVCV